MKRYYLILLIAIFTSLTQVNAQCQSKSFINIINKIDTSITFDSIFINNQYPAASLIKLHYNKHVSWSMIDSNTIIAFGFNLFGDNHNDLRGITTFFYKLDSKELFVLNHLNEESTACRDYFVAYEVLLATVDCFMFDSACVMKSKTYYSRKPNTVFRQVIKEKENELYFRTYIDTLNTSNWSKVISIKDLNDKLNFIRLWKPNDPILGTDKWYKYLYKPKSLYERLFL